MQSTIKKIKTIYANGHALIRRKPEFVKKLKERRPSEEKNAERPLSVLLVGIDGVSRLNLLRTMPITAQHLHDKGWFELKGYHKVGENTFPNLMGLLTGYNITQVYEKCDPKIKGKLDTCPFLWKEFNDLGYASAYAEDETKIGSFTFATNGFLHVPTTHYFRPFAMAAQRNLEKRKSTV